MRIAILLIGMILLGGCEKEIHEAHHGTLAPPDHPALADASR